MDKSELPMALRAAYIAMHRLTDAVFVQHGVTADQFVLMATLARGDAMTQRELARRMPSDPSTVRAMLVLLEKQGLVQRDVHPEDSRARAVTMTTAGKRKFQKLWRASEEIRAQMIQAVQPHEVAILLRLLKQLAGAFSADIETQAMSPRSV